MENDGILGKVEKGGILIGVEKGGSCEVEKGGTLEE